MKSLYKLLKNRKVQDEKEMFSTCIDEFTGELKNSKRKKHRGVFTEVKLEVVENEKAYIYVFTASNLSEDNVNISYKDEYLTLERTENQHEAKFFRGVYEKNSIVRVSSRSYYLSGIDESKIEYKFSGNKLTVYLPKNKK